MKFSLHKLPEKVSLKDPSIFLATWFGSGLIKPASGTFGTLASLPFGIAISYMWGITGLIWASLFCLIIGIHVANQFEEKTGQHDASPVVIDETCGMWIALIPAAQVPALWVVAFLLFRLFDISKPWPCSHFDNKKSGGWGVMMDDVVAGIFAFIGVATVAYMMHIYKIGELQNAVG